MFLDKTFLENPMLRILALFIVVSLIGCSTTKHEYGAILGTPTQISEKSKKTKCIKHRYGRTGFFRKCRY